MFGKISLLALVLGLSAAPLAAVTIIDYPVAPTGSAPYGITSGPDGNVWFTGAAGNNIFRVTPSGLVTQYVLPNPMSGPHQITAGPDGNLWFTEHYTKGGPSRIGRLVPATGTLTEFPLANEAGPAGITTGPDGALWFTEPGPERIGRITTSGTVSEYSLPNPEINLNPDQIVSGPDGALWFTLNAQPGGIGRITITGAITIYPVPGQPRRGLVVGPDSNLWFILSLGTGGKNVVRMTLDGSLTHFPLPYPISNPWGGITSGPDGNLWFGNGYGRMARMTPEGVLTEFRLATNSFPLYATTGPDGNVWFTEGDYVGKIVMSSQGFYPLSPCRVIDTRNPPGPDGAPALAAGSTRAFKLSGKCGVPSLGNVAVAVNLTVTNTSGHGHLRITSAGYPIPFASSINFSAGQTRANNMILPVNLDGEFTVYCEISTGGSADFIVDVAGHFQ